MATTHHESDQGQHAGFQAHSCQERAEDRKNIRNESILWQLEANVCGTLPDHHSEATKETSYSACAPGAPHPHHLAGIPATDKLSNPVKANVQRWLHNLLV